MKRNVGLDVCRSVAILMVLACHSLIFFYGGSPRLLPWIYLLGLGVDIFFALSGFLIGGALIRDVVEQPTPSLTSASQKLLTFYMRRWLRTLPLYYLMVAVSVLYLSALSALDPAAHTSVSPTALLANLLFVQNFRQTWLALQPVAWSLAIEEWFYLLLPLGMLAISFARTRRLRGYLLLAYGCVVIVAELIYRASDFLVNHALWDFGARKQIFMRMDALMFGILAAWLFHYHAALYARLARSRVFAGGAALVVVAVAYTCVYAPNADNTIDTSFIAHTLALTALGTGFAALVIVCQAGVPWMRWDRWGRAPWAPALVRYISTRSYSYYLIHWPIALALSDVLAAGRYTIIDGVVCDLLSLALAAFIAEFTYRYVETAGMRLREQADLVPALLQGVISLSALIRAGALSGVGSARQFSHYLAHAGHISHTLGDYSAQHARVTPRAVAAGRERVISPGHLRAQERWWRGSLARAQTLIRSSLSGSR